MTLSLGQGHALSAFVTFDRKIAAKGGRVFVADIVTLADEDAVRLSEAVIVRRGGLSSRAGLSARRYRVPAVSLGQGRWDAAGPTWTLEEPIFGDETMMSGFAVRPVIATQDRTLREGDAVAVDPVAGTVEIIDSQNAAERVAVYEAVRTYDGLRDAQALEQWVASESSGERRARLLMRELVWRASLGLMPRADFVRVKKAMERLLTPDQRRGLAIVEKEEQDKAQKIVKRREAKTARDRELKRVMDIAARSNEPVKALALAAGADVAKSIDIPIGAWKQFITENDLQQWLEQTVQDASLGLRRKSARIEKKILSLRLDPSSAVGRNVMNQVRGPALVVGDDAAYTASTGEDALKRVVQVWAASWKPGPLGTRLRAGRGLAYEGCVRIEKIEEADFSGSVFSRDPGSGRADWIYVEFSPGSYEHAISGDADVGFATLERESGREVRPRRGGAVPAVTALRLEKIARAARAYDAWKDSGVELGFSFVGDRLIIHHARALEAPASPRPAQMAHTTDIQAERLDVKPVGL